MTLHYIRNYFYSDLSKSNFTDHHGDTTREQCLGTMISEMNVFSVCDEMLRVMAGAD